MSKKRKNKQIFLVGTVEASTTRVTVLYLYISCYLSDNKLVLSYLLLCLLPQYLQNSFKMYEIRNALLRLNICSFLIKALN